jgi:hypothetical protein
MLNAARQARKHTCFQRGLWSSCKGKHVVAGMHNILWERRVEKRNIGVVGAPVTAFRLVSSGPTTVTSSRSTSLYLQQAQTITIFSNNTPTFGLSPPLGVQSTPPPTSGIASVSWPPASLLLSREPATAATAAKQVPGSAWRACARVGGPPTLARPPRTATSALLGPRHSLDS